MKTTKIILMAALIGAATLSANAGVHVGFSVGIPVPVIVSAPVVTTITPAPIVETAVPCPGVDYVWASGYWSHTSIGYSWVRGRWNYRSDHGHWFGHFYGGHRR
ncbi:MAG TPA: YXWGXW repeat-containing protein [Verrucomicrobiae bacterium]|jgi:hypothetical protein